MRSRYGRRAFRAYPIRCVGERIKVTGVPEFREVAWRAWFEETYQVFRQRITKMLALPLHEISTEDLQAELNAIG